MTNKPTVWRVVWERAGLTMRSDWSIHYEVVREFYEEKRTDMPGTEPRMESSTVEAVSDVKVMDFGDDGEDDDSSGFEGTRIGQNL